MSSVNYSLKHKGVRLIPSERVWIVGKNGKVKPNPDYHFVGKMDVRLPTFIISMKEDKKPSFRGNVGDLSIEFIRMIN